MLLAGVPTGVDCLLLAGVPTGVDCLLPTGTCRYRYRYRFGYRYRRGAFTTWLLLAKEGTCAKYSQAEKGGECGENRKQKKKRRLKLERSSSTS